MNGGSDDGYCLLYEYQFGFCSNILYFFFSHRCFACPMPCTISLGSHRISRMNERRYSFFVFGLVFTRTPAHKCHGKTLGRRLMRMNPGTGKAMTPQGKDNKEKGGRMCTVSVLTSLYVCFVEVVSKQRKKGRRQCTGHPFREGSFPSLHWDIFSLTLGVKQSGCTK